MPILVLTSHEIMGSLYSQFLSSSTLGNHWNEWNEMREWMEREENEFPWLT